MDKSISTINELQKAIKGSTMLQEEFKNDPIKAIESLRAIDNDKWIYRLVVLALGITIVCIVIGTIILIATGMINNDNEIPTILTAIGSAAIGALAGLLAPSPRT